MEDDVLTLTANIVSAHVTRNEVGTDQLSALIKGVYQTLATVGQTVTDSPKAEPAVSAKNSVFPDHIVCLDCGEGLKLLKRHIRTDHNLTPLQYRLKWGLPNDYPMIAAEYSSQRSQMAFASGLGKKAPVEPAAKKKGGRAKKGE
jgi:predicted transcriptional regulator